MGGFNCCSTFAMICGAVTAFLVWMTSFAILLIGIVQLATQTVPQLEYILFTAIGGGVFISLLIAFVGFCAWLWSQ